MPLPTPGTAPGAAVTGEGALCALSAGQAQLKTHLKAIPAEHFPPSNNLVVEGSLQRCFAKNGGFRAAPPVERGLRGMGEEHSRPTAGLELETSPKAG